MTNQRGFTLIEMAIVLAIIGLLVGGGLVALGPILDKTRITQTNSNLDQIENALVLFAIRNNRLPCPADGSCRSDGTNCATGGATYGQEVVNTGTTPDSCSAAIGNSVIPWITLGLDEGYSVDGWNNRISYVPSSSKISGGLGSMVDGGLYCLTRNVSGNQSIFRDGVYCDPTNSLTTTGSPPMTQVCSGSSCSATVHNVPSYPFGMYIPVYQAGTTNQLTTAEPGTIDNAHLGLAGLGAAYVLVSHGKSGWYAWNKAGVQMAAPGAPKYYTNKYANSVGAAGPGGGVGFFQGTPIGGWPPGGNASYFDDIVRWRSPALIIQLCGAGACGNP